MIIGWFLAEGFRLLVTEFAKGTFSHILHVPKQNITTFDSLYAFCKKV